MAQSEKLTSIKNNLDIFQNIKKVARVLEATTAAEARLVTAMMVSKEVGTSPQLLCSHFI